MKLNTTYYVYLHVDPDTREPVYVGKGRYGRAWDVTRVRAKENHLHCEWLKEQAEKGFLPCDWVVILEKGLTEDQAFAKEKNYLHTKGKLRFNRQSGEDNNKAILTDEQAKEIFIRAKKETHSSLAKEFGVSRPTVSMIASRRQWKATTASLING